MKIRLFADFFCYALWLEYDNGNLININSDELPLSSNLKYIIKEWEWEYDSIYNDLNPVESNFKTKRDEEEFIKKGYEIKLKLQNELDGVYNVEYIPSF